MHYFLIQNKIEPAMTANGWSNMVEEELLPPTAGDDRQLKLPMAGQACPPRGLLPMMTSRDSHCSYTSAAVCVCKCKRRTSGKLVMKTLRASYSAANGWPADLRTIVEPDADPDMAICRTLCRFEPADDVMALNCSWWCERRK